MTRKCSKKVAALIWALLECMFFSSVVLGWTWLAIVFRSDSYFPDYCNVTLVNRTLPSESSEALRSVDVIAKLGSESHRTVQRKGKTCRLPRGADQYGKVQPMSLKNGPVLPAGESLARNVFIEGEWGKRTESPNQQRFKRGDGTNLSTLISSLRSNPLSAASSITQAQSGDAIAEDDDTTYVIQVVGYCFEQNETIRIMFAVVCIIRDVLTFPLGYFFDKYGTTRTRLLTVIKDLRFFQKWR